MGQEMCSAVRKVDLWRQGGLHEDVKEEKKTSDKRQ